MAKRDNSVITLGSGDLMIKEWNDATTLTEASFTETDLLGRIQGGATLEYKPTFYEAKDDAGKVAKVLITEEEATLKSGVITWNGETLKKLCSTAAVTTSAGKRTVKIGGPGNNDGKSYALCFHHTDKTDGDVWIIIRGVNQNGFELSFAKDKETVIDAEFKCMPMDSRGTLITFIEDTGASA